MMRRILSLAVVAALAVVVTTPLTAHAGVAGELDAFAEALGDLASVTEDMAGTLEDASAGQDGAGELDRSAESSVAIRRLAAALGELHVTTGRVAAAGVPVADHLAHDRLGPGAVRDALGAPVRSLARAVEELGAVSVPVAAQLWGRPVGAAAAAPAPGELLAPGIQALAAALETLSPALEALAPVIEPLAPAIGPACGQLPGVVFLALGLGPVLVPVLVPVPLPSLPTSPAVLAGSVLAPVFLLCAALPVPAAEAPAPDEGPPDDEQAVVAADTPPPPPPSAPSGALAATASSPPPRVDASFSATASPAPSSELAAPSPSASSGTTLTSRAPLRQLPLFPVDHEGEATSIALLVLVVAAAAGAVTFFARRRASAVSDWSAPAAAAAGVGALAAGGMAWSGAAEQVAPWAQVPYLISGGMTALVLGLVATTLALVRPIARLAGERA